MVELPTTLIGRSFSSSTVLGLPFSSTSYSNWPIFDGAGRQDQVLRLSALTTSAGERPLDCSARGIEIDHDLPLLAAVGVGDDAPGHGDELGADEVHRRGR